MGLFLLWSWFFCLLVLTGYTMVIFRRRVVPKGKDYLEWPGVSVVIAHKNHSQELIANLPFLVNQDFPDFDITIIDDHSADEEYQKLKLTVEQQQKVKLIINDGHSKRSALQQGVQVSQKPFILFTDADCKPMSMQWIKMMMLHSRRKDVVLGYSPYRKDKGWLNTFVRFETLITGIQYFSWALAGRPYMAVGRNLMYPRSVFSSNKVLEQNKELPYGDDDLGIQNLSDDVLINVCYDAKSHVVTTAPATWNSWWNQKHRHLSAGHHYKAMSWWRPGVYGIAMVLHWLLLILLIILLPWWRFLPVLLIGLFIRWMVYAGWTRQLGDKDTVILYPMLELNYAIYLGVMGFYTLFNKKKTWS